MDGLVGIAIAVAIIVFIVWLIGKIISIALFVVIVIPIYIVLAIYAGIKFIGMSTFIAMDKLFYLGFDIPVIAVWIFWGTCHRCGNSRVPRNEDLWAKKDGRFNSHYPCASVGFRRGCEN